MPFSLSSEAFAEGAPIPTLYTCEGRDASPPLAWSGAPEGTRSFCLVCDDPDAPGGTFSHWAIWDMPTARDSLPGGVPAEDTVEGMHQARNDFGRLGYGGPCPPHGHGPHRYRFRLYALDSESLDLPSGTPVCEVAAAAEPHALASVALMGTFERP